MTMRLLVIVVLLIGTLFLVNFDFSRDYRINGVSLVSPPNEVPYSKVAEVKRVNAEWVSVIPYGFSRKGEPNVTFDHHRQWWGERTEGTSKLIDYAKLNGLKVMLKPHVWVLGEGWTGDYSLDSELDWKTWESNYLKYILHYARVADSLDVELYCIGTEYRIPARNRPEFWRNLIEQVKNIYKGKITYASNWDNYDRIEWWDQLDYIGVDAYFPLSEKSDASIEDIKEGWSEISMTLESFSNRWRKPILFTEYGFQSVRGGAGKHWEVNTSLEYLDLEIQSKAYEATYQVIWNKPWFAGGFLWKWHLTSRGAERNKTRFTPQGKPAEKVISEWYEKRD